MRQRLVVLLLSVWAVLVATIAPTSADATSAPKTYTLTAKQFCQSFGHHVSCRGGYHDFNGTITHYQIRFYGNYNYKAKPFSGNGTTCKHISLTWWSEYTRDAYSRFNVETTNGTSKGTNGTPRRTGSVRAALNKKPFAIKYAANYSEVTSYMSGTATGCTTKDGKK